MRTLFFSFIVVLLLPAAVSLNAQPVNATSASNLIGLRPQNAIENERHISEAAYAALRTGGEGAAIAALRDPRWPDISVSDTAIYIRRLAVLCAWISNDNDPRMARRIAQLGLAAAPNRPEQDDADRLEHLYWEAWLRCEILDDPATADALLDTAEGLSPTEGRLKSLHAKVKAIRKGLGR